MLQTFTSYWEDSSVSRHGVDFFQSIKTPQVYVEVNLRCSK